MRLKEEKRRRKQRGLRGNVSPLLYGREFFREWLLIIHHTFGNQVFPHLNRSPVIKRRHADTVRPA